MKKVLFDLDDTLYQSKELWTAREEAIKSFLKERTEEYTQLKKQGHGTISALKQMGISRGSFFEVINSVEITLSRDERLVSLISSLKKKYFLVLLSNSPKKSVIQVLSCLGVLSLFDEIFSSEDFESEKPAEECFFMLSKEDIAVGNDFEKDLAIPKQIGALTIHLGEDKRADHNINEIYELETIL